MLAWSAKHVAFNHVVMGLISIDDHGACILITNVWFTMQCRYYGFIIHIIDHWLQQVDISIIILSRSDSHICRRLLYYYDI